MVFLVGQLLFEGNFPGGKVLDDGVPLVDLDEELVLESLLEVESVG